MKQLKNFLIKREQSQACLSFAKREKSRLLAKTLLTLVALLAVTTGAWAADVLNLVVDGTSATLKYDGNASNNPYLTERGLEPSEEAWEWNNTIKPIITTVTIDASCNNYNGTSLHVLFDGFSALTTINGLENLNTVGVQDMEYMFAHCSSLTSLDLSSFNTASVTTMSNMFNGCSKLTSLDLSSWNTENVQYTNNLFYNCSELTTVDLSSWNTAKVWNASYMFYNCSKLENIYVGDGWSTAAVTSSFNMFDGCTKLLSMNTANPAIDKTNAHTGDGGYLKVKPAAVDIAWDKTLKTGIFTQPAGNVTVSVEYFPQAALTEAPTAINDVPATTDGAIVKAGTVANIGSTETAQGTVMYYVSTTALDDDALLALDADDWKADVPTAESLAEGQAYVYYYVRGNDSDTDEENFSDGDILAANALNVTIAAEPTYAVTFADGVNPEPPAEPEWTASPNADVKKGQTVTVTYTGTKKVIGVKAEKKAAAAAKTLSEATLEDIGKIAGADGNIYDTKAAAEAVATGNAVAMIAYVGSASDCTHGLAIALADESGTKTWSKAGAACSGKTAVTGGTWRLPSIKDWQYMFIGCGASGSYSDSPRTMSYSELATKLTTANGTALQTVSYWSSTESSPGEDAWSLYFGGSSASFCSGDYEGGAYPIRACLAF